MKFQLTFKTPDVLDQLHEVIEDEGEREQADKTANDYLRYGEYITVEFDTDDKSATVKKK